MNTSSMDLQQAEGRFMIFTNPRTASNLLMRLLNLGDQLNVNRAPLDDGYFFLNVQLGSWIQNIRSSPLKDWTEEQRCFVKRGLQDGFDRMEQYLQTAKAQNKTASFKEHCMFIADPTEQSRLMFGPESYNEEPWVVDLPNYYKTGSGPLRTVGHPTFLPDAFLTSGHPLFLIRHPALVFPSDLRTARELPFRRNALLSYTGRRREGAPESVVQSFQWIRDLHDWYYKRLNISSAVTKKDSATSEKHGTSSDLSWPIVLEADDIMTEPQVLTRLCNILGIDPKRCKGEWTPLPAEELADKSDIWKRMTSTITSSSKIVPGKTAIGLDINAEVEKWKAEFGDEEAAKLEKAVWQAMPHYEHMRARRLRP